MTRLVVDARMADRSGIGTYIRELLPRIARNWPGGEVRALGDSNALAPLVAGATRGEVVEWQAPIYSISEQLGIGNHLRRGDLLWVPHYNAPVFGRVRMVVTVHDVNHLALGASRSLAQRAYARLVFGRLRSNADALIFPSEFTAAEFARHVGAPRGRTVVTPEGVAQYWFAQPGRAPDVPRPYLLFVGNLKPHKNLPRLLRAFTAISDRVPHTLVLVGKEEGFITGDLGVRPTAGRMNGRVVLAGEVSDEELRRYYAHADLLVLPSLYEGFGLPPLEAMAAGCPVAVSRGSSLPEVCGDAAAYFDPGSEDDIARVVADVLTDGARRAEMRERGLRRARIFNWDDCADATLRVLTETAEPSGH